jgi:hypothetical protein
MAASEELTLIPFTMLATASARLAEPGSSVITSIEMTKDNSKNWTRVTGKLFRGAAEVGVGDAVSGLPGNTAEQRGKYVAIVGAPHTIGFRHGPARSTHRPNGGYS